MGRNPEITKEKVIVAAAHLFNSQGVAGTSMDEIIAASGVQKGGIYTHFKSKSELAIDAFKYSYGKLKEYYWEKMSKVENRLQKLVWFLDIYEGFIENPPVKGGCPLLNSSIEADDTNPEMMKVINEALDDWISIFIRIIKSGQKRGEIKTSIDAQSEAMFLIATIEGGIMMGSIKKSKEVTYNTVRKLKQYIMKRYTV